MVRLNKKLFATAALTALVSVWIQTFPAAAAPCPSPFSELLIGTNDPETANMVLEWEGGLLVLGARTSPDKKSQAFAWKLDRCGNLIWKMTLAPDAGSNFLTGAALADGSVLLGGSAQSWDDPDKSTALIVKLNKNGQRVWSKPFVGAQNLAVTNLAVRDGTVLAVLQPHARKKEGDAPEKLKPEDERPIFITIDGTGALADQFAPLAEEKAKLFHVTEIPGTSKLLASGRFSYFGQPTRPGIWEIDREADTVKRLYSGDTIGLSFSTHANAPKTQLTLLWRSRLGPNAVGDPISLTRLDDGLPKEVWAVPQTAAATLPATSLRARNGDFVIVLQSFPRKEQDVTVTISRVSPTGSVLWTASLVRPHGSAVTSIIEMPNRNFMLAGRTSAASSEDGDAWLFSIDADGAIGGKKISHRW